MIAEHPKLVLAAQNDHSQRIQKLQQTVSASRLNTWQSCRLKFYFRYVLKIKRSQSSAQYVGSLVHWILQAWNMSRWKQQPIQSEQLKEQFEESWTSQQVDKPLNWLPNEEQESKSEAWSLLTTYFRDTPIEPDEKPEGVEVSVEADLTDRGLPRLIGILDLVRQGRRIVGFKTAGQTPNSEKAGHLHETQLSCYSLLYRENTGKQGKRHAECRLTSFSGAMQKRQSGQV